MALLLRWLIIAGIGIAAFALLYTLSGFLTQQNVDSMTKISDRPSEIASSGDVIVYKDGENLQLLSGNAESAETIVQNFKGTNVAVSEAASYISFSTGDTCTIWSIAEKKTSKTLKCSGDITWIDDVNYLYFQAVSGGASDHVDDEDSVLVHASTENGSTRTQRGVSQSNNIYASTTEEATYIILSPPAFDAAEVCVFSGAGQDILSDCDKLDVSIRAVKTFNGQLMLSTHSTSGDSNIFYKQGVANSNINLLKTVQKEGSLYAYNETNPYSASFTKLLGNEESAERLGSFDGLRAHSVIEIHTLSSGRAFLEASNGLWEAAL